MLEIAKKAIEHPDKIITNLGRRGYLNWMSDEQYIRILYRMIFKRKLNLGNPQTFNEKLQWLKLHDHNPLYTRLVDKYEVKQYVADLIGEEYIIPTLGVWNSIDEVDFDSLPNQFVLKCTHDSGGLVICRNKNKLDVNATKKKLKKSLNQNFFYFGREWPYKNVKPRIIAEKYMTDESGTELKDYKIFNFDGKPKLIQVDYDRFVKHKRNLYSTDWKYIEAAIQYPTDPKHHIERPKQLDKMLSIARVLSAGISHVRTDLYCIDNRIYFGELTFYHESGLGKFTPEILDEKMGEWIKLPSGGGYLLTSDGVSMLIRTVRMPDCDEDKTGLTDYKFLCFNGEPQFIEIHKDRFSEHTQDFYDISWKPAEISQGPTAKTLINPPQNLDKMIELSRTLSGEMAHVRIDWYEVAGKLYFGEITFYDGGGFEPFDDIKSEMILGNLIHLPIGI